LLIFSAVWMSRERISRERWQELALPQTLGRVYYPFLGAGTGRVVDARTGEPVKDALISVTRVTGAKSLLVARKLTRDDGEYSFGAWAGQAGGKKVVYEIQAAKPSYKRCSIRVRLRASETLRLGDVRLRLR
jgi:5-hydroxyisourate hydrolase-like protein (transthyretin family)